MEGKLDKNGHEVLDPNPMEIPAGFRRPPTMKELIQRVVRVQLSEQAQMEGNESFAEADDFVVGDDDDAELRSPYQLSDEQEQAGFIEEKPVEHNRRASDREAESGKKSAAIREEDGSNKAESGKKRDEKGRFVKEEED